MDKIRSKSRSLPWGRTKTEDFGKMNRMSQRKALERSKSIDSQLAADREKRKREIQLLILGGAGTGKSTFIKQLRIHHGDGYPEDIRESLRSFIYDNVTDAVHAMLDRMRSFGLTFHNEETQKIARNFTATVPRTNTHARISKLLQLIDSGAAPKDVDTDHMKSLPSHVIRLAEDEDFRRCCDSTMELTCSEKYFLENLNTIKRADYVPSVQDILYMRQPTLGVQEHTFNVNGLDFRAIDVAGQKSQRKKWICFFEDVTSVIFFVSLSGYCENLEEEATQNSLQDSLQAFQEVVHNEFLRDTNTILFLNKNDLFREKLKKYPLISCFPDYIGENTPDDCLGAIKHKFESSFPTDCRKTLKVHVSCATDMNLMRQLIKNVLQLVIDINMRKVQAF